MCPRRRRWESLSRGSSMDAEHRPVVGAAVRINASGEEQVAVTDRGGRVIHNGPEAS